MNTPDTAELVEEEPNKLIKQDAITKSAKEKEFKFNPSAAEFKPTLAAAVENQDSDKHESTDGYVLGGEQQYAGGSAGAPSAPTYDPDYAAWFARQQAWQQHYAWQIQQGHGYY